RPTSLGPVSFRVMRLSGLLLLPGFVLPGAGMPFVQLGVLSLEFPVDRFTRAFRWVFLQFVRFIAHGGSPMVFTGRTGKDAGCFAKRCKSFRPLASRREESRSNQCSYTFSPRARSAARSHFLRNSSTSLSGRCSIPMN